MVISYEFAATIFRAFFTLTMDARSSFKTSVSTSQCSLHQGYELRRHMQQVDTSVYLGTQVPTYQIEVKLYFFF
jgi:hypothetical protein